MKYFITVCLYSATQLKLTYYTDEMLHNDKGLSFSRKQDRYMTVDTSQYSPDYLQSICWRTFFLIGDEGCTGLRNTSYGTIHDVPRHKAPRIIKDLLIDSCKADVIRDIAQCALGKDTMYANFYRGILNALDDALTRR